MLGEERIYNFGDWVDDVAELIGIMIMGDRPLLIRTLMVLPVTVPLVGVYLMLRILQVIDYPISMYTYWAMKWVDKDKSNGNTFWFIPCVMSILLVMFTYALPNILYYLWSPKLINSIDPVHHTPCSCDMRPQSRHYERGMVKINKDEIGNKMDIKSHKFTEKDDICGYG